MEGWLFSRPIKALGYPIAYNGAYWMRGGEALVPMTRICSNGIFEEAQTGLFRRDLPARAF